MNYKSPFLLAAVLALLSIAPAANAQQSFNTQLNLGLLSVLPQPTTTDPPGNFNNVHPGEFDPGNTQLVQSMWINGIGCPDNAFIAMPNSTFTGVQGTQPYADPACPIGDSTDQHIEGLLMAKTGPTANFAAATAELINVKSIVLTELGYDIRKSGSTLTDRGSHCGAGAPRFDIVTQDGALHFIGCNSPPPTVMSMSNDYLRLRWAPIGFNAQTGVLEQITQPVQRIVIVFDEGSDTAPDNFGAAILDNIDVNGTLVGAGASTSNSTK